MCHRTKEYNIDCIPTTIFHQSFLYFFVHTSRYRDLIAMSSLSHQRPTVDVSRNRTVIANNKFWPSLATRGLKFGQCGQNWIISENYTNQYEVYSVISIPDNCWKLPIAAIFWPPEGNKWSAWRNIYSFLKTCMISANTKYEVDWAISILNNCQTTSVLEQFSSR